MFPVQPIVNNESSSNLKKSLLEISKSISNKSSEKDEDLDNFSSDEDLSLSEKNKKKPLVMKSSTPKPKAAAAAALKLPPPEKAVAKATSYTTKDKTTTSSKAKEKNSPATMEESLESLIGKLNQYQAKMSYLFTEKEQDTWNNGENSCSENYIRQLISKIRARLRARRKEIIVNHFFDKMCDISEAGMVNFMMQSEMVGFSDYVKDNKAVIQDDLDEIAIEMSDDYVPGPKIRLFMGLMTLADQFKKSKKENKKNINKTDSK